MDASFSRTDLIDLNQSQSSGQSFLLFQSAPAYKTAKVHFVVNSSDKMGFDYKEQEFNHDNINRCKALGFSKTGTCAAGQYAVRFCPYDNAYFSQCCDNTYAYSSQLANNKSYGIDSNGFIYSISSPSTVYVVEDSQIVPLINSKTGSPYTNVYGPEALKYSADLCGSTERPTIKVNTSQSQYVLSRNFTGS